MGGKATPLTQGQAEGLAVVVVLTVLLYAGNVLAPLLCPAAPLLVPCRATGKERLAVALQVDGREGGVYFLPQGATVADLLQAAHLPIPFSRPPADLRRLKAGQKVFLAAGCAVPVVGDMPVGARLALDLSIDLNKASLTDLVLVPGIGEKTAARIVTLRDEKKGFHSLTELAEIKGIKEKKLAKLRRYFAVTLP